MLEAMINIGIALNFLVLVAKYSSVMLLGTLFTH